MGKLIIAPVIKGDFIYYILYLYIQCFTLFAILFSKSPFFIECLLTGNSLQSKFALPSLSQDCIFEVIITKTNIT